MQPRAACSGTGADLGDLHDVALTWLQSCCSHRSGAARTSWANMKLQPSHCPLLSVSHLFSPDYVPAQVHLHVRAAGAPSHRLRPGRHLPALSTHTRAALGRAPEGRGRSEDAPSATEQASPAAHTCSRSVHRCNQVCRHWGRFNLARS